MMASNNDGYLQYTVIYVVSCHINDKVTQNKVCIWDEKNMGPYIICQKEQKLWDGVQVSYTTQQGQKS